MLIIVIGWLNGEPPQCRSGLTLMVIYRQEKIAPPGPLAALTSEPADGRPSDERPGAQKLSRRREARQVAEEYANDLREILKKLRKLLD